MDDVCCLLFFLGSLEYELYYVQLIELSPMGVSVCVYLYWCAWHVACVYVSVHAWCRSVNARECVCVCMCFCWWAFLPVVLGFSAPPCPTPTPIFSTSDILFFFFGASSVVKLPRVTLELHSSLLVCPSCGFWYLPPVNVIWLTRAIWASQDSKVVVSAPVRQVYLELPFILFSKFLPRCWNGKEKPSLSSVLSYLCSLSPLGQVQSVLWHCSWCIQSLFCTFVLWPGGLSWAQLLITGTAVNLFSD